MISEFRKLDVKNNSWNIDRPAGDQNSKLSLAPKMHWRPPTSNAPMFLYHAKWGQLPHVSGRSANNDLLIIITHLQLAGQQYRPTAEAESV